MDRTYPTRNWRDQLSPSLDEMEMLAIETYAHLPEEFRKLTGEIVIQFAEYPPEEIMARMVAIAKIAKERGVMALENEKPDDEFSAKAFQFLADGFDEAQIKELLQKDINLTIHPLHRNWRI